jgi:hypothetical protein
MKVIVVRQAEVRLSAVPVVGAMVALQLAARQLVVPEVEATVALQQADQQLVVPGVVAMAARQQAVLRLAVLRLVVPQREMLARGQRHLMEQSTAQRLVTAVVDQVQRAPERRGWE